ncbi:MAG: F0F1 ATP synthase subunit A [Nitriliruptorales bacterium]
MTPPVLLAAEGGGFQVPTLEELFEFPPLFFDDVSPFGIPLAFNRTALLIFLSVAVLTVVLLAAFRNATVVPSKFQAAMEAIVGFVRDYIVMEVIGPAGLKFVPFLTTLFLFIWVSNLFEITPFINFPTTSRMALPAFLALVVWTIFIVVGMKEQGPLTYLRNVAIPPGVPAFVLVLVIPIEIVSTFIVRPLTLAIRLFANMLAGHIILTIAFIAANAFLLDVHAWPPHFNLRGSILGALMGFGAGPALVAFEFMVASLQAYIFTILAAVYISSSMHPEH